MTSEPSYLELGVPDADLARAFYGAVLGWRASGDAGNGQVDTDSLSIGIHGGDPDAHFEVFFNVDDLAAAAAQVVQRGGRLISEETAAEGFGRYVECADDQGVRFGLRQAG